jgi:hypothetical protein
VKRKSLKNMEDGSPTTATYLGPKPTDFPIGSVESRAAARAVVQQLARNDGPQPGDMSVDFSWVSLTRAEELWRLFTTRGPELPDCPGPKMWITFPEGFKPPES